MQRQIDQALNPTPTQSAVIDILAASDESFGTTEGDVLTVGPGSFFWGADPLTLSGSEITDALRKAGVQGDGRTPPGGIGIWEATTNLCTNGGFESGAAGGWGGTGGATISQDATQAKFGTKSLKVVASGAGDGAIYSVTVSATTQYTYSAWVFCAAGCSVTLKLTDNIDQGLQSGTMVIPAGVWTRVSFSGTTDSHTSRFLGINTVGAGATFFIDGVQLEQKSIATPYVETNGGTASRSAARVQAPASLLNATQGWIALRFRAGRSSASFTGGQGWFFHAPADGLNFIRGYYEPATSQYAMELRSGGVSHFPVFNGTFAAGDIHTLVFRWTASGGSISVDGAAFGATVAWTAFSTALATFDIGSNAGATPFDSDVLWLGCGTGTLIDADAATLAALGGTPPSYGTFPGSQNITMIWPAVTSAVTSATRWNEALWS